MAETYVNIREAASTTAEQQDTLREEPLKGPSGLGDGTQREMHTGERMGAGRRVRGV